MGLAHVNVSSSLIRESIICLFGSLFSLKNVISGLHRKSGLLLCLTVACVVVHCDSCSSTDLQYGYDTTALPA